MFPRELKLSCHLELLVVAEDGEAAARKTSTVCPKLDSWLVRNNHSHSGGLQGAAVNPDLGDELALDIN